MDTMWQRQYTGETKPIEKALATTYPELPYSLLRRLLRQKDVFVNGARRQNGVVTAGDTMNLYCLPSMIHLKCVYRSGDILVLYKPKGVASDGERSFATLVQFLYPSAQLLHRLDTNTDGLLLFALTQAAYDVLYEAMRAHRIVKTYRAKVWGRINGPMHLHGYLQKDAQNGVVRVLDAYTDGAFEVACDVMPVSVDAQTSVVDIVLKGGKTHQLRAQLAHCGHFIVGDGKYGMDSINRQLGYSRQQLTAYKMQFETIGGGLQLDGVCVAMPNEALDEMFALQTKY